MADNEETSIAATGSEESSTEETKPEEIDALLSRLRVIEDQPLEDRAAAFAQVHDELRRALEGADAPAPRD